jgi:hypothetical protein
MIVNTAMNSTVSKEIAKVAQSRRLAAKIATRVARAMPISRAAVLVVVPVGCAYRRG